MVDDGQEELAMVVFGLLLTQNSNEKRKRSGRRGGDGVDMGFMLCVCYCCRGCCCCASVLSQLTSLLAIVLLHTTAYRVCACPSSGFPPHNRTSDHKY